MPPTPTDTAPAIAHPGRAWLRWTSVVLVLAMVAFHWSPQTGFTELLRFGDEFSDRRLPEIAALPVASVPGKGYDGQFYAQLAVSPNLLQPAVQASLDVPAYRAQRILLPLLAHLAIKPWWVLQVFALLNVAAWLWFAAVWWTELRDSGATHPAWLWTAGVFSLGALDSLHFSLVDLPATLLILLTVRGQRAGRRIRGGLLLAAAGLTRETALLAFPVVQDGGFFRRWIGRGLCALPALGWFVWLRWRLSEGSGGFVGNFDWPGHALVEHLVRCGWELSHGNTDSRFVWGLIGGAGFAFQSIHLLAEFWRTRKEPSGWLRASVLFAVLFWFLGSFVWSGYWAVARTCLPMTLAFNFTLPKGRGFWWRFALGNACLLHGVYRLLPAL